MRATDRVCHRFGLPGLSVSAASDASPGEQNGQLSLTSLREARACLLSRLVYLDGLYLWSFRGAVLAGVRLDGVLRFLQVGAFPGLIYFEWFEGPQMLRNALVAIGALIVLYLVWNLLQFLVGTYKDRRATKRKGSA